MIAFLAAMMEIGASLMIRESQKKMSERQDMLKRLSMVYFATAMTQRKLHLVCWLRCIMDHLTMAVLTPLLLGRPSLLTGDVEFHALEVACQKRGISPPLI